MDNGEVKVSNSGNIEDYEILIRKRGEDDFASYSPQINKMFKAKTLEEARRLIKEAIEKHVSLRQ
ncbi:MAG: hypothetical protein GX121_09480 [Ignavibacteria bacterium]|jgi:predicted RNase H-like HicB family nuclease|nr:hypothetical protein [Ignavibacteria bacterium]